MDQIRQVYFIGIGGIGMSALARYFRHLGCLVAGYDKTETDLTSQLVAEGIQVNYTDDFGLVNDDFKSVEPTTLIVYTPAVPKDLEILNRFQQLGHPLFKRSQVLGLISQNRYTIAVAGTHGKTTTSTMIAHIFKDSGYDCSAFLGGISANYDSNVLYGDNKVVVIEADEYDRSFLTLHPDIAVVTSADADHLDIYGDHQELRESFRLFLNQLQEDGTKIVRAGLPFEATTFYAAGEVTDAYADRVRIEEGDYYFDFHSEEQHISDVHLGMPGHHNVENAVAAITVALKLGVDVERIRLALSSFLGVKRRFEYIVKERNSIYIDDYAHHPEELRAFLGSVKALYPKRRLTVVFQPHLFSRTRDFVDGFAEVLSMADELLLMEIYPARELPIAGITSQWLLDKIQIDSKQLVTEEMVKKYVRDSRPELLVTVGAGNIDRLIKPLGEILKHVE